MWDAIDREGKWLFIERQANRRGEEAATKTESSVRPIPPGLPPLRFYDLRHMVGTLMHEAGIPL